MRVTVALLLFPEVEVLDFAGPFEVFAVTDELRDGQAFHVVTVAPQAGPVRARHGLTVVPDFTLATCPPATILVVPGGYGTRALLHDAGVLAWLKQRASEAEVVLSVCTGSMVLARLGLLDGLRVTTHHSCLAELAELAPAATVDASQRFHDHPATAQRPRVVTAAGISAGIDASLHLVASRLGRDAADTTARYMEYGAHAQPGGGRP